MQTIAIVSSTISNAKIPGTDDREFLEKPNLTYTSVHAK